MDIFALIAMGINECIFPQKKNPLCKFEVLCLLKKRKRHVSFGMHGEKGLSGAIRKSI